MTRIADLCASVSLYNDSSSNSSNLVHVDVKTQTGYTEQ